MKVVYNPTEAGAQEAASPKKQAAKDRTNSEDTQHDVNSKADSYTLDIKSKPTTVSSNITNEAQATQYANNLKETMLKNPILSFNSLTFDHTRVSALFGIIASDQAA